jgi:hypothetical protein
VILLFFFLPSNFFRHLAFLIVFELLTSLHNVYNLLCCLIFMLRFCSCFCFVPSTKRNTGNAPKCVRKGTKKTPKGRQQWQRRPMGAQSGPQKLPRAHPKCKWSLQAPLWRAQGSPGRPPRAPQTDPKTTKIIDFPLGFDGFRKNMFFGCNAGPNRRKGNAAKVQERASERPKNESLAHMLCWRYSASRNLQNY